MNVKELFRKENNSILYRFLGDPKKGDKAVKHPAREGAFQGDISAALISKKDK
ncbi:hypothetical protein [Ruminococcus sp. YE71]|uniref:hypothetical protein n=1 Tax=Ruminococcus sp. YE71 TaxID=244362 RepID=UPI000AD36323|nr:hypothetical protein [Ruminococcus sp. YE71]